MTAGGARRARDLARRLAEAEATIEALVSGQIDAVVDATSETPIRLVAAQAELRDNEERYRRIVETANEGIWTIDSGSNVSFVNRRFADMLGFHRRCVHDGHGLRESRVRDHLRAQLRRPVRQSAILE
jgi:PAS domain-containing protein